MDFTEILHVNDSGLIDLDLEGTFLPGVIEDLAHILLKKDQIEHFAATIGVIIFKNCMFNTLKPGAQTIIMSLWKWWKEEKKASYNKRTFPRMHY